MVTSSIDLMRTEQQLNGAQEATLKAEADTQAAKVVPHCEVFDTAVVVCSCACG
jgi:hypothetical protein